MEAHFRQEKIKIDLKLVMTKQNKKILKII